MRFNPASVIKILTENFPLDSRPISVIELATQVILNEKWRTDYSEAREKAEAWQDKLLNGLRNFNNDSLERGQPCRFSFNSSSDYMIQGACFIEPRDTEEISQSKRRRLRYEDYYQILVEITPNKFEALCGKIVELIGVQKINVTRHSADEGIDFYGQLKFDSIFFPQDLTPTIQKQLKIWIVGQAKRHVDIKSNTAEIRDLVGAVELARARAFGSLKLPYSDLRIRVCDPVYFILITTSRFSANAITLLERSGVIGMDGNMIAAFLADREAGIGPEGFSEVTFFEWVNS